jgi:hypothetical protein
MGKVGLPELVGRPRLVFELSPLVYPVHRRPSRADRSDGATGWKLSRYQRIVGLDQTRRSYRLHDSGRLNRYAKNSPQLFPLPPSRPRASEIGSYGTSTKMRAIMRPL